MEDLKLISVIFLKELKEGLRDRKTLLLNYGLPLIVMPFIILLGGEVVSTQVTKLKTEGYPIYVLGNEPEGLVDELKLSKKIKWLPLPAERQTQISSILSQIDGLSPKQNKERTDLKLEILQWLKSDKVKALVYLKTKPEGEGKVFQARILFDNTDQFSIPGVDFLSSEVAKTIAQLRTKKLRSLHLKDDFIIPFSYEKEELEDSTRSVGKISGSLLIYLVLIILCLAGFYPALNSTAGERELNTLSMLLSTPVSSETLIYGKFLGVLASSLLGLLAYGLSSVVCKVLLQGASFSSPQAIPNSWLGAPLLVLSAASLVASISLAIGFLSKKRIEAQAFLSWMMIFILAPAIVGASFDLPLSGIMGGIPILNLALVAKNFFTESIDGVQWILLILSNGLVSYGFLKFSTQVLKSEYAADSSLSDILTFDRQMITHPTPALSVLVYLIVLMASLYLNFILSKASILIVSPAVQILVFLLIPLLLVKYFRLELASTFQLRLPRKWTDFIAALMVALASLVIVFSFLKFETIPKEMLQELEKKFHLNDGSVSVWTLILATAVLPGICEEMTFRGLVLAGFLKRFSSSWAVGITAFMFGLNHFSIGRMLPTTFLGVVLGYTVVQTRSIFPGMLIHVFYNTILIAASKTNIASSIAGTIQAYHGGWVSVFVLLLGLKWMSQKK